MKTQTTKKAPKKVHTLTVELPYSLMRKVKAAARRAEMTPEAVIEDMLTDESCLLMVGEY